MMKKSLQVLKESFSKGARCAAIPISADQAKLKKKLTTGSKRKLDGAEGGEKRAKVSKDSKKQKAAAAAAASTGVLPGYPGSMDLSGMSYLTQPSPHQLQQHQQQSKDTSARSRTVGVLLSFLGNEEVMKAEQNMVPSIRERPSQLTIPSPSGAVGPGSSQSANNMYRRTPQPQPTPQAPMQMVSYPFPQSFDFGYSEALPSPVALGGMFPLSPINRDAAMNAAAANGYFFGQANMPMQPPTQMPQYWAATGYPTGGAPIEGGAPAVKKF